MGDYIATQNLKITNFKPVKGRIPEKNDVVVTNDENGKFKLNNVRYKNLMDMLKELDKNPSLSSEDLKLSKTLIGQLGVQNVMYDRDANVARFVFDDGDNFRVDMGVNNQPAIKSIQKEITDGNATYASGVLHYIMQYLTPHTVYIGDEIVINELPEEIKTLGDAKAYYNLPDGCLRNNVVQGGGNFDLYEATAPLYIHVGSLAKGLGVTNDQIEALFNLNKND